MKDSRLVRFAVFALMSAAPVAGDAELPTLVSTANGAPTANAWDGLQENDGPCQAIRKFASDRLGKLPADQDLHLHFPCALPPGLRINFLIAAVPNPIDTHLQLWFDRSVESIQSAAGYSDFRFHGAWIPWDADLVREEPDIEKRKIQQALRRFRETEPGVLFFRAPTCDSPLEDPPAVDCRDLVVLLVPETPTAGLAEDVFRDAIEIARSTSLVLKEYGARIPFLGPSFSGSFSSLGKIMARDGGLFQVISGTAAGHNAWQEAFPQGSASSYNTTVHSTNDQLRDLYDYMKKVLDQPSKIALVTESESGLGWNFVGGKRVYENEQRIVYRYPREISRLRSAYGDQELKAVVGAQQQTPSFRRILGFRLFDIGPSRDTIPVMATNQTPFSQDAVLDEIAQSMQRDRITLAGIVATDVFDALFVARYLRDACPDIRLFTFDSDLLYEKAAEDFPFDGILAVSTYPLIASNQVWTNMHRSAVGSAGDAETTSERTLFPSRGAEGMYNAMRILLVNSRYAKKKLKGEPLAEYFNPTANCPRSPASATTQPGCETPPIWITVVTRNGYWPLALTQSDKSSPPGKMISWPSEHNESQFGLTEAPRIWAWFWVLLVLLLCWYFFSQFAACAFGLGKWQGFAHLNPWPNEEGWHARLCYLLVCGLSLLALYGIYILPLVAISHYRQNGLTLEQPIVAEGFFWLFAALVLSPCLTFRKGVYKRRDEKPPADAWHFAVLACSVLFFLFLVVDACRLFPFGLDRGDTRFTQSFFMAYRSLHINSGVSPLLPLVALLGGYFGWGRVHLKRVTMRFEHLGSLPNLGAGSDRGSPEFETLAECQKSLEELIDAPLPLNWRTVGGFALATLALRSLLHALTSLEPAAFDHLVLLLLAVLYALLFLTWSRMLLIWNQFHPLLEQLERHPMRFAFSDLPCTASISPMLQLSGRLRHCTLAAVRDSLRKLFENSSDEEKTKLGEFEPQFGEVFVSVMEGIVVRRPNAEPLLNTVSRINDVIVEKLNDGYWRQGHSERKNGEKESDTAEALRDALREEIIAIQCRDYIYYIVHQMQNLVVFVVTGFLLSMLALECYPFRSPRMVTTFITVMFLVLGAGVVTVMAQADRDPILSRITKTTPHKLSGGFFLRVAGYLGLPFITVLASQFPSWGRFLFSWIQPTLEAIK